MEAKKIVSDSTGNRSGPFATLIYTASYDAGIEQELDSNVNNFSKDNLVASISEPVKKQESFLCKNFYHTWREQVIDSGRIFQGG